ncbi:TetR/AcrR family transcriptional regulator [Ectothiorhodospiraceae bacterium WFHF3C12]|nr:TetR/AcrR family transcriptional regulator [Ectothiorhodospiraceae bacterium WFHF3C12]
MTSLLADDPRVERPFCRHLEEGLQSLCRDMFREGMPGVRVQKEDVAVGNLLRIVEATLAVSNEKGFAAMSLRDLAGRTGLSMGGIYAYIAGKDDLVALIQTLGGRLTRRVMAEALEPVHSPVPRLRAAIRTHLRLSEALRPWFFFAYMESRLLPAELRAQAINMERDTEAVFAGIVGEGQAQGVFRDLDADIAAGFIKALVQDWYLKHGKHAERGLRVDDYADHVEALALRFLEENR